MKAIALNITNFINFVAYNFQFSSILKGNYKNNKCNFNILSFKISIAKTTFFIYNKTNIYITSLAFLQCSFHFYITVVRKQLKNITNVVINNFNVRFPVSNFILFEKGKGSLGHLYEFVAIIPSRAYEILPKSRVRKFNEFIHVFCFQLLFYCTVIINFKYFTHCNLLFLLFFLIYQNYF